MQKGDKVTHDNYKRGYKVSRAEDWEWKNQGEGAVYGIILNNPPKAIGTWIHDVDVLWIDQYNKGISKHAYRVGRMDKFDLVFFENTVDYDLDDIFSMLDMLEEQF